MTNVIKFNDYTNKRKEENVMNFNKDTQVVGTLTDRDKLDLFRNISKLIKEYCFYNEAKHEIESMKMMLAEDDPDREILNQLEIQNEEQGNLTYATSEFNENITLEYKDGVLEGMIMHHEGLEPIYMNKWDTLKTSMYKDDVEECEELYNQFCKIFKYTNDPVFYGICDNLEFLFMTHNLAWNRKDEFYYQDLFKKHYKSFLPLTELVERKNNPKHHPDAWLKENGEYIPVEVKLEKFGARALKQLNRYMEFYDCKNGIAVADELTVELPDNIQFVNNKELTELEKQK